MSYFEDFNKIHLPYRIFLITTAVLMPFYYVALYLLRKPFIVNNNIYTITVFCFCFAFGWALLNVIGNMVVEITRTGNSELEETDHLSYISVIYSIVYLCPLLIGFYLAKRPFLNFIAWNYISVICIYIMSYYHAKKEYKKKVMDEVQNANQTEII